MNVLTLAVVVVIAQQVGVSVMVPIAVGVIALVSAVAVAWVQKSSTKVGLTPDVIRAQMDQIDLLFRRVDSLEGEVQQLKSARELDREMRHEMRGHIALLTGAFRAAGQWATKTAVPLLDQAGIVYEPAPPLLLNYQRLLDARETDLGPPDGMIDRRRGGHR